MIFQEPQTPSRPQIEALPTIYAIYHGLGGDTGTHCHPFFHFAALYLPPQYFQRVNSPKHFPTAISNISNPPAHGAVSALNARWFTIAKTFETAPPMSLRGGVHTVSDPSEKNLRGPLGWRRQALRRSVAEKKTQASTGKSKTYGEWLLLTLGRPLFIA